jgi:glycosyltransferase involved in cell wall biosynthesis
MPVHDAAPFLERALRSVLEQSLRELEVIAVDDGSTDGSREILERLAASDRRLRLVFQDQQGVARTLNRAWDLARGPFVARMDADDVSHPMRLARQVAELEARPELAVVGCRVRYIDEQDAVVGRWDVPTGASLVRWTLLFGTALAHPAVVIRRATVGDQPPYSREATDVEDYDLWVRLAPRVELDNLPYALLDRRVHSGSIAARRSAQQLGAAVAVARAAAVRLAGIDLSRQEVLALTATTQMATAHRESLSLLPRVLPQVRRGYLRQWPLSRAEIRGVTYDTARRFWGAARVARHDQASLAARLAWHALRYRAAAW